MIRKNLEEYIKKVESDINPVDEFIFSQGISGILNLNGAKLTDDEEIAEYIAFEFVPNQQSYGWGLYYGPKAVGAGGANQPLEFPSLANINQKVINYWRMRKDSPHPVLARQYADLVLEFEPKILDAKFDYLLAQKVIDETIKICSASLSDAFGCKSKIERALDLAKRINDAVRIEKVKSSIIETERRLAEDDKPGLWGYAFELLLLDKSGKVLLSEDEKTQLILEMENRIDRLSKAEDPNPWFIENAAMPLSQYYFEQKDENGLKATLEKLEAAFRKNKHANSDGLLITNYLERLLNIYLQFSSNSALAKESYERILTELSNLEENQKFKGQTISVETTIPNSAIEGFVSSIFGEKNENDYWNLVFQKIVIYLTPKKDSVEQQLRDLAKKHPFQYFARTKIMSDAGYTAATLGSLQENFDFHLLNHFSQSLHFTSVLVKFVFDELKKRITVENFYSLLVLSPSFSEKDKSYILKLLRAFWNGDYLVASCLSVPLIEDAVRNIFRLCKVGYIKPNKYSGGFDVLPLGELLRSGLIKQLYGEKGGDMEYYFRVVLTDPFGWNLRNNFAHGISKWAFEREDYAYRLMHVIMCLALVRKNEEKM